MSALCHCVLAAWQWVLCGSFQPWCRRIDPYAAQGDAIAADIGVVLHPGFNAPDNQRPGIDETCPASEC